MKGLFLVLFAALLLVSIVASPQAQAQSYAIPWWTADGGGGTSTGGSYTLSGTIGQPDAGILTGGSYTLTGGFWGQELIHMVYLPLILKQ